MNFHDKIEKSLSQLFHLHQSLENPFTLCWLKTVEGKKWRICMNLTNQPLRVTS